MSEREWRFYLADMISFAEKVLVYTEGLDQAAFVASGLNYDATVRNLELIGEAATHIPVEIQERHSAVPWRQVIATRNRLIHGYLGIDNDTLWSIIKDDDVRFKTYRRCPMSQNHEKPAHPQFSFRCLPIVTDRVL